MRGRIVAGEVFGWLGIVIGALVLVIGIAAGESDDQRRRREMCEAGILRTPGIACPPRENVDRPLMVSAGLGGIAGGVSWLLLAGILGTLVAMREEANEERHRR